MGKKKNRGRRSKPSSAKGKSRAFGMDGWELPEWIKDAGDLAISGDAAGALELLGQERLNGYIEAASMPEKGYMIAASARLLKRMGQADRAEGLYKQLLELGPNNVSVINEMAGFLTEQGKIGAAVKYLEMAMEIDPDEPRIWGNMGANLIRLGQKERGIELLKKAVEKRPDDNQSWSTLLLSMHYLEDVDRAEIFKLSRQWAEVNAAGGLARKDHKNTPDAERKLRIGYVSGDFREHSVMYLFEPVLSKHSRELVEVYGYGTGAIVDAVSERVKGRFDHYRNIYGLDDKAAAAAIEKDRIDILVDLAGHMGGSGIYAMAHKPAPIQVTWLGYPDTTGMSQMDYRLTDAVADPDGSDEYYSEKLFRLPDGFLCYDPCGVSPAMSSSPFTKNGYITFGCFNNSSKINAGSIELWSKILKAVDGSKILLKFKAGQEDEVRDMFVKRFAEFGISPDRVIVSGWLRSPEHLELYNQVDIALDTYPYNGTVTTLQSLMMGVPVVSLVGEHHMSRVGLSILKRLDLEFFAAMNAEEYVSKAAALAKKPESLDKIRMGMRTRLAASSICNNNGFTIKLEQAYRSMWREYCHGRAGEREATEGSATFEKVEVASVCREKKAKRGVVYVIWGNREKDKKALDRAVESVKKHHPELPIHIERFEKGSKISKTRMLNFTPFEETVYLDNDTIVMSRLDYAFDKARQFGLACCINENPWARRFGDSKLCGDMIEYNAGVLFFTEKARPVFDRWTSIFPSVDCSLLHYQDGKLCKMPAANQASLALAVEQTGFHPFILPINWNLRPQWFRSFYGPVKIWHDHFDVPQQLIGWNKLQSDERAIIQYAEMDVRMASSGGVGKQSSAAVPGGEDVKKKVLI